MLKEFNNIKTIRYMGNKNKLLDFIIPEIKNITKKGDIICDLMCGTCSIGYALKDRNCIYSNDIQYYSYIIGKGMIENNAETINETTVNEEIIPNMEVKVAIFIIIYSQISTETVRRRYDMYIVHI